MTKQELFDLLEIEEPVDFAYFEQFADLIECEEEIPSELIALAFDGVDPETAAELIENYFEDLNNAVPDNADDLVSLIDSIKQNMLSCAQSISDVNVRAVFADQIACFREWFHRDKTSHIDGLPCSVFYAVTEYRSDKLGNDKRKYDFSEALDYDLDSISINLGSYSKVDILAEETNEDEDENYD